MAEYGGHPDYKNKRWIKTVWDLKEGDTFTTTVEGKVCIFKVEGFYHSFLDGWCPTLKKVYEL